MRGIFPRREWDGEIRPENKCMEVTAHTGQTEAAYSEAAAADMSQTEEAEKGYKR